MLTKHKLLAHTMQPEARFKLGMLHQKLGRLRPSKYECESVL